MKRETEPVNVNVPVSFWLNGPNHRSHPRKKKNVILVLQLATRSSDDITLRFSTLAQPPPLKDGLMFFFFYISHLLMRLNFDKQVILSGLFLC